MANTFPCNARLNLRFSPRLNKPLTWKVWRVIRPMPHQRSKTKIQGTGGDKYKQSLLRNTWHSLYLSGWTNCIYPADKLYLSRNLTAPSIEKASTSGHILNSISFSFTNILNSIVPWTTSLLIGRLKDKVEPIRETWGGGFMVLMTWCDDDHVGHYHWSQYRNPAWRWVHPTNPAWQPGLINPELDLAETTLFRYDRWRCGFAIKKSEYIVGCSIPNT